MIIGIDAAKLSSAQPTGVEVATIDLVKAILTKDKLNTYWLYSAKPISQDLPWSDRVKNVVVPGKKFWTQRYLSQELRRNPPDVFWSPGHILPNHLPKKSVATIHDLAFHIIPNSYSFKDRWLSTIAVQRAVKRASKLVAVSQQTKKDLKRYFNILGDNIEVVYHALRSDFVAGDFDFAMVYPNLDKYFLCVGRIEFKKNIPNILAAFAEFNLDHPEVKLVLAGNPGSGYNKFKKLIKKLNISNQVVILNYVSPDHLPALYAKAQAVVFVSKYEGFGFPILEGWASQVPVMASNIGAMPEVAGNAALLVDPNNIAAIQQGLVDLLTNDGLRQALVAKGQLRLKEFSWDKSAQKMIDLWTKL